MFWGFDKDRVKVTNFKLVEDAILVKLETKWDLGDGEEIWCDDDELLLEDFSMYSDYVTLPHANRKYKKFMYEKFGKAYADRYFSEY